MSTTSPKKAVGTAKTEQVIGSAAAKLSAAVKSANDALQSVAMFENIITEKTVQVTDLENKIANLESSYAQKTAEANFKMDLAFKTNRKQFAEQYLDENDLISVSENEYVELQQELNQLKSEFNNKVNAEVGKAMGIKDAQVKAEKALLDAEYKAKEAGNIAKIENLEAQLKFANEQVALWKGALDEERKAGVQRAQAAAIGAVNVTASK